jgi:two-component system nitrogen regulation response regulator GlnG
MQSFEWRGNVRQLENVCLWLTVMATGDTVMMDDLPPELLENSPVHSHSYQEQPFSSQEMTQDFLQQNSNGFSSHGQPNQAYPIAESQNWQQALAIWAEHSLQKGETDILQVATPEFERVLLTAALKHSGGKKIAAANLLGWGRNTLTRKLQQLDFPS